MTKFNTSTKESQVTENYMGSKAYKMTPQEELYNAVCTNFVTDSYYESEKDCLKRITNLISKVDPEFVAKLAVYCREEMYLRTIPLVLLVELSKVHSGSNLVSNALTRVIKRPDELTEVLAYYQKANKRKSTKKLNKLSNQIKRGVAKSFSHFDEYQFAKYNRDTDIKLKDALFLTHPKAVNPEQQELFDKIVTDTLETPYTWEVELSKGDKSKKEVWEELIDSKKVGYMAMLRNLRNITEAKVSKAHMKKVCEYISNPVAVKKSRQLPFRFLSAYQSLGFKSRVGLTFEHEDVQVDTLEKALVKAVELSCDNIPVSEGKTVILSDNSGSMTGDRGGHSLLSFRSERKTSDIANLFALLYWRKAENTFVGLFGDKLITPKLDREKDVFKNFKVVDNAKNNCGPGTEEGVFVAFEKLIKDEQMVDRIIIFSDQQVGRGCSWYDTGSRRGNSFNELMQKYMKINPKVKIYSIDLKGYGNKITMDSRVVLLTGWSDKIFDMVSAIENGSTAVKEISKIQL